MLELQVDAGSCTLDTVNDLLRLYSRAVEFYDDQGNEQLVYAFEGRIQNMLIKPEVIRALNSAMKDLGREEGKEGVEKIAKGLITTDAELSGEEQKKERLKKLKSAHARG